MGKKNAVKIEVAEVSNEAIENLAKLVSLPMPEANPETVIETEETIVQKTEAEAAIPDNTNVVVESDVPSDTAPASAEQIHVMVAETAPVKPVSVPETAPAKTKKTLTKANKAKAEAKAAEKKSEAKPTEKKPEAKKETKDSKLPARVTSETFPSEILIPQIGMFSKASGKYTTMKEVATALNAGTTIIFASYWSKILLHQFNYATIFQVPVAKDCSFPNDLDLAMAVILCENFPKAYCQSILTEAMYAFLEADLTEYDGVRVSNGMEFQLYEHTPAPAVESPEETQTA